MLYVKVVTPLVLKRWVWPMIKCSHLTPKSIYSYIDDLVIANCLIDARIGCACFATYFICHFIVWACWLHILLIRGHPLVVLIVWVYFLCQVDGQECLRTSSSYLCFSRLKLYSCYITKFDQVRFEPLCVRSTRSPRFVIDLNFQNLFVHFGLTVSSISVIPRSLSRSRLSISMQPIWTFWSPSFSNYLQLWISVPPSCSTRSHRQGRAIYSHGQKFGNFSEPLRPRDSLLCQLGLRIVSSPPAASSRWSPSPSTEIQPRRCRRSESPPN